MDELNSQPGMVGLTLAQNERLWDIAKKYHTTVEAIKKTNHLEEWPTGKGVKILLMKRGIL